MKNEAIYSSVTKLTIDEERSGQRLDNFLLNLLKPAPKSLVYRIIRTGQVRINGKRAKPSQRLATADEVRIPPLQKHSAESLSGDPKRFAWLKERIIYEDQGLLAIDKPGGIAVHGGSGMSYGVIEAMRLLMPQQKGLELIHRLDRDTSGCLLLAKKRSSLRLWHELIRERQVEKRYLAIVEGDWQLGRQRCDLPLLKTTRGGERYTIVDKGGQEALTEFKLVELLDGCSVVEAKIETGRMHQIRVHCAALGHPIIGDRRYGNEALNQQLKAKQMCLHASSIGASSGENTWLINAPTPDHWQRYFKSA